MTNGNSLDPWYDSYAQRTAGLSASEVRALSPSPRGPRWSRSPAAMPYVSALPRELVTGSIDRVMTEDAAMALQYGGGQGLRSLREHIVDVMSLEGIRASAEDVVVTTGVAAARARPRHAALHRPGRRRPGRVALVRRCHRGLPVVPGGDTCT